MQDHLHSRIHNCTQMDQLITMTNELQDTCNRLDFPFMDLPQIVMIGSQSAGKSSVLENIVRREFLPRGTGIVTRCPLVLHLIHENDDTKETKARFLHTGDVDYYDFDAVKKEIMRQTEVLAGHLKNISDQPITLKIYSPDFPNLTLIDLPGLTKVPVESQPRDIDQQIKNICLKYARQENSIILAVSQGNVDLANSDSLRFAEELDPEGKRTLCVITKLDIMDKGTDAYDILTGKVLRKELGYIGVVSRSQADIKSQKTIEESLLEEKIFFEKNYPDIAQRNGTPFLTDNLNKLLKKHIRKCLPSLRDRINEKIKATKKGLEILGPDVPNKRVFITKYLNSFNKEYTKINEGNFDKNLDEIRGGALIGEILYEQFPVTLMKIDVENDLTYMMIKSTMRNTCGADKMSFSRERAFKSLVKVQIKKLNKPSLKCIDDVLARMKEFVKEAWKNTQFSNFPNLTDEILEQTYSLIEARFEFTKTLIKNFILSEMTDVMCVHPNYKMAFVLEEMSYQDFPTSEIFMSAEQTVAEKDKLIVESFEVICKSIEKNIPEFCRIMIYFITSARMSLEVLDVFRIQSTSVAEKATCLGRILDDIFVNSPQILQNKDIIINSMMDPDTKFYDCLMHHELDCRLKMPVELELPVNKHYEYTLMKKLVVRYFIMVQQNVCYHVPKLIKTFLVIHVRDNLVEHLQCIYSYPDMERLLLENNSVETDRANLNTLLQELESMKKKIDDMYDETV